MSMVEVKDDVGVYPKAATASGSYDQHAWNTTHEPSKYSAMPNSWEYAAIRQAMIVATLPRTQVRRLVKPPLPQIAPKGVRPHKPIDIYDCIDAERNYADQRAYFSGGPAGYSGSPRNNGNGWGGPY